MGNQNEKVWIISIVLDKIKIIWSGFVKVKIQINTFILKFNSKHEFLYSRNFNIWKL